MSQEISLDESITVTRPLHEVFAYISDFSRIEEWDPAVARGTRLTSGALGIGSEFRIDMKTGFSLHYRVIGWQPNQRTVMTVDSKLFTAVEEIRFSATPAGTNIRYIAKFSFPFALRLIAKAFPGVLDRVGKAAMTGMKQALEDDNPVPVASRLSGLADRLLLPGLWRFTRFGYKQTRKDWSPLSSFLKGRHIVITGATSGLGLAAAETLAERGAELTLVARDEAKARKIAKELKEKAGNPLIHVEIADLSVMADVLALAKRLIQSGKPIHALINNAGALINPREETREGIEKSFALLLLGPYLLTECVHPLLKKEASSSAPARVVNVLSGGMYSQRIRVDDLQSSQGNYSGAEAYARAKRGLMIATEDWATRWRNEGIVVNAMHPGWADTPGVVSALPGFHKITRPVLRTPAEGADTIVWLATASEAAKVSGQFWLDRQPHPTHLVARTRETAFERQKLLDELNRYCASTLAAEHEPA